MGIFKILLHLKRRNKFSADLCSHLNYITESAKENTQCSKAGFLSDKNA